MKETEKLVTGKIGTALEIAFAGLMVTLPAGVIYAVAMALAPYFL